VLEDVPLESETAPVSVSFTMTVPETDTTPALLTAAGGVTVPPSEELPPPPQATSAVKTGESKRQPHWDR